MMERPSFGRVAVIHDWLTGMRGGEHVLEAILDLVPNAELFTLFHFPGSVSKMIESHAIHTSRLQSLATRVRDYRTLLPLFPRAVRRWDLSGFDLVISSSHAVAKGVDARGRPHLCYCHTPMRYIWDRFDDYFPRGLKRLLAKPVAARLRRWDVAASKSVTQTQRPSRQIMLPRRASPQHTPTDRWVGRFPWSHSKPPASNGCSRSPSSRRA